MGLNTAAFLKTIFENQDRCNFLCTLQTFSSRKRGGQDSPWAMDPVKHQHKSLIKLEVAIMEHSIKKKPPNFGDAWLFKEVHLKLKQFEIFVPNLSDLHLGCTKTKFEMSRNQSCGDKSLCDSIRGLGSFYPHNLLTDFWMTYSVDLYFWTWKLLTLSLFTSPVAKQEMKERNFTSGWF